MRVPAFLTSLFCSLPYRQIKQNTSTGMDSPVMSNPHNSINWPGWLFKCTGIFLLLILVDAALYGQDTGTIKNKWHYLAEPYVMFPNMNGTAGLGNLPDAEVNADAGDIFNHLQFGAMLYFEAHNDHWAISSDVLYMSLKQDVAGAHGILSGEAQAKQLGWELAGLRKLSPWLEVGGGILLNSLKSNLDLRFTDSSGTITKSKGLTQTWVDPTIIARITIPTKGKFSAQFRGNIGGFGIGSKLSWQLQAYAGYRFSKLFELQLGYRVIGVDYEKGSGEDRFLYDVNTFGPVVRFGFHF